MQWARMTACLALCLVMALSSLSGLAHAGQKIPTLDVSFKSNGSELCKGLDPAIEMFLLGINRYSTPTENRPREHQLVVECKGRSAVAKWRIFGKRGRASTVAKTKTIVAEPRQTPSSFAFVIVKSMMEALPWSGELIRTRIVAREKVEFLKTAEGVLHHGELSSGVASDVMLERCLPFEVLAFSPKDGFQVVGSGLILDLQKSSGAVEYSIGNTNAVSDRMFYRFLSESEIPDGLVAPVSFCRWYKDGVKERYANDPFASPEVFASDEWVELRGVMQKGQFYIGRMSTSNQLDVAQSIALSITNRVDFGNWVSADMRAFRTVVTSVYSERSDYETRAKKPVGTLAEGYGLVRYGMHGVQTAIGAGLIIDKFNVPYMKEEDRQEYAEIDPSVSDGEKPSASERTTSLRLAGMLRVAYSFQPYTVELRLNHSWSTIAPATGAELTFDYALTRTWFTGMSLYYLNLKETGLNEPSVTFSGVGAHIGISLNRPAR